MYHRKVTVRASNGTPREYLRLQESYRVRLPDSSSKHRQRVICSLGRVDLVASHAVRPYELLTGQHPNANSAKADSRDAWDWGPLLVLHALRDDHLRLDCILRRLAHGPRDLAERKLVVTNGAERARKVLRALKIKKKPPPGVQSEASETATGPDVVTIRK